MATIWFLTCPLDLCVTDLAIFSTVVPTCHVIGSYYSHGSRGCVVLVSRHNKWPCSTTIISPGLVSLVIIIIIGLVRQFPQHFQHVIWPPWRVKSPVPLVHSQRANIKKHEGCALVKLGQFTCRWNTWQDQQVYRADSMLATSNAVSHWLGANLDSVWRIHLTNINEIKRT